MCSGSKKEPSETGLVMEGECGRGEGLHHRISALLEFAASDDVIGFKYAVEKEGHDVDEVGLWYGRKIGSKKLGYEERTPLMVAAMFGSLGVLTYILRTGRVDVNRASGSDGATALHCAVSGGSSTCLEIVKLLLNSFADVCAVDVNGHRSCDLIVSMPYSVLNSRKRILQALLEGSVGADPASLSFEESVGQIKEQQSQGMNTPRVSKDYPVDHSLPDIKNGIYGTDEFRMYTFKVKPCSRAYSHDWTECPFVHPGENARRRDPRQYHYSCVPCPEFRKGSCSKGDACEYAHGIFECWLHPAQYRTRLCKDEGGCTRKVCFFAHRPEELRPLYASTGSAMPSPRSYSASTASLLEIGAVSPVTLGSPSVSTPPPLTPSGSPSPMSGGSMWQAQSNVAIPTLQLPKSRLQTALAARDMGLDVELFGIENHRLRQRLMMDEISGLSSPSSGWKNSMPNSPSFPVSFGDHAGELNLNRLSGVKPANIGISLDELQQSPTGIQMLRNHSGSPMALSQRIASFSKRSQSFIERGVVNHHPELPSRSTFSDWGSPDGKVDWAIHGEELSKLRKSASFGFRSSSGLPTTATIKAPSNVDEPDVSWVHSLVKDAPFSESGQCNVEDQQQQLQCHHNNGTTVIPAWLEQMCLDQEQMVA